MPTLNLGKVKFLWKGTWVNSTNYTQDDVVFHDGSSYIALQTNSGQTPDLGSCSNNSYETQEACTNAGDVWTPNAYWDIMAQNGDAGTWQHPQYTADNFNVDLMGNSSPDLDGAEVLSGLHYHLHYDQLGSVTDVGMTFDTRDLTLADLGYQGATDADKYTSWKVSAPDSNFVANISTNEQVEFTTGPGLHINATTDNNNNNVLDFQLEQQVYDGDAHIDSTHGSLKVTDPSTNQHSVFSHEVQGGLANFDNANTYPGGILVANNDGIDTGLYYSKYIQSGGDGGGDHVWTRMAQLSDVTANEYNHPNFPARYSDVMEMMTGAEVPFNVQMKLTTNDEGHVTDADFNLSTRTLDLADLGYTGDNDANKYVHPVYTGPSDIDIDISPGQGNVPSSGAYTIDTLKVAATFDGLGHVTALDDASSVKILNYNDIIEGDTITLRQDENDNSYIYFDESAPLADNNRIVADNDVNGGISIEPKDGEKFTVTRAGTIELGGDYGVNSTDEIILRSNTQLLFENQNSIIVKNSVEEVKFDNAGSVVVMPDGATMGGETEVLMGWGSEAIETDSGYNKWIKIRYEGSSMEHEYGYNSYLKQMRNPAIHTLRNTLNETDFKGEIAAWANIKVREADNGTELTEYMTITGSQITTDDSLTLKAQTDVTVLCSHDSDLNTKGKITFGSDNTTTEDPYVTMEYDDADGNNVVHFEDTPVLKLKATTTPNSVSTGQYGMVYMKGAKLYYMDPTGSEKEIATV